MIRLNHIMLDSRNVSYDETCCHNNIFHIYNILSDLQIDYPNFHPWFFKKVLFGLSRGTRFIVTRRVGDELAGVAILKKENNEKKICTLRILKRFSGQGIGSSLLVESMSILDTERPLITVSETRYAEFCSIFKKFGFQLCEIYPSLYRPGVTELSFNGFLDIKLKAFSKPIFNSVLSNTNTIQLRFVDGQERLINR